MINHLLPFLPSFSIRHTVLLESFLPLFIFPTVSPRYKQPDGLLYLGHSFLVDSKVTYPISVFSLFTLRNCFPSIKGSCWKASVLHSSCFSKNYVIVCLSYKAISTVLTPLHRQMKCKFGAKTRSPFTLLQRGFFSKDGDDLLSHLRSTIGVVGLNFSVRNGKRWDPDAVVT